MINTLMQSENLESQEIQTELYSWEQQLGVAVKNWQWTGKEGYGSKKNKKDPHSTLRETAPSKDSS